MGRCGCIESVVIEQHLVRSPGLRRLINCGIPNRAFVIVAKLIEGDSSERAGRVWYEAVCRVRLGPDTNFHEFARKTLAVSKVRFGGERRVTAAV